MLTQNLWLDELSPNRTSHFFKTNNQQSVKAKTENFVPRASQVCDDKQSDWGCSYTQSLKGIPLKNSSIFKIFVQICISDVWSTYWHDK